jgi:hypothetical protein
MFSSRINFTDRMADATDLLIAFATLGEYGLEPTARATPSCESHHRPTSTGPAAPQRRRPRDLGLTTAPRTR